MTSYDQQASGARTRTVGLCAGLLELDDVHLDIFAADGVPFLSLIEEERGRPLPAGRCAEHTIAVDPARPLQRALQGPQWVRHHVRPERHDLFLTDYYPVAADVPTVLSIHDLRYSSGESKQALARRIWFRAMYPRIARQAALVLTLTHARAIETSRLLGVCSDRISVCGVCVTRKYRTAQVASGVGLHMLAVGMGDERKGADVLCAALRQASGAGHVLPLVMTGRRTPFLESVLQQHRDLLDVRLLRYEQVVSEERLISLYQNASVLLHPSRYEGFGIPVLEAMTLGVPVVAASDPAVQEVGGDSATYLAASDIAAWARTMTSMSDPASAPERPDKSGLRRSADMGWDAVAGRLLPCLRRAAALGPGV